MPRPEGQRCLIIASKNHTVSYSKKGVTTHRFLSLLPGGSPQTGEGSPPTWQGTSFNPEWFISLAQISLEERDSTFTWRSLSIEANAAGNTEHRGSACRPQS